MNEINWHHPKNSSISWLEVKDTSYTVYYIDLKTFACTSSIVTLPLWRHAIKQTFLFHWVEYCFFTWKYQYFTSICVISTTRFWPFHPQLTGKRCFNQKYGKLALVTTSIKQHLVLSGCPLSFETAVVSSTCTPAYRKSLQFWGSKTLCRE